MPKSKAEAWLLGEHAPGPALGGLSLNCCPEVAGAPAGFRRGSAGLSRPGPQAGHARPPQRSSSV